uniref:Uncharacterized protein n=1 Tax=Oryza barthii TaxID=65489 RepID=A0A0D3GZ76_9ORYZ
MPLIKAKRSIKGNPLIRIASQRVSRSKKGSRPPLQLWTLTEKLHTLHSVETRTVQTVAKRGVNTQSN